MVDVIVEAAMGGGFVDPEKHNFLKDKLGPPMIIVASAPRSGSTYLTGCLRQLSGLEHFRLCTAYSSNEHDLYLPSLMIANRTGCISQQHTKGTYNNIRLAYLFGISPIIMVRNIFDTVVSLAGDLRKKESMDGYELGVNTYSFLWLNNDVKNTDDDALIDMIIDLCIPWYINFYVSWSDLCAQNQVRGFWVSYEDLMMDRKQVVTEIFDFLKMKVDLSDARVTPVFEKRYGTFNKGEIGRGETLLSDAQKTRIRKLFSYYPTHDFSRLGI
jgi:hypothetical protein